MNYKNFVKALCLILLPSIILSGCTVSDAKSIAEKGVKSAKKTIESVKSTDSSASDSPEAVELPYEYQYQDMDREGLKTFFKTDTTIEKTVLFDDHGAKITADSLLINEDDILLNLEIENDTNHDLRFTSSGLDGNQASINGFALDELTINELVLKRETKDITLSLQIYPLLRVGIDEIHTIVLPMQAQLLSEEGGDVLFKTGPLTIKTSAGEENSDFDPYKALYEGSDILSAFNLSVDDVITDTLLDERNVRINHAALVTEKDGSKLVNIEYENYGTDSVEIYTFSPEINDVALTGVGDDGFVKLGPSQKYVQIIDLDTFIPGELLDKFGLGQINKFSIWLYFDEIQTGNILTEPELLTLNFNDESKEAAPALSFGKEQGVSFVANVYSGGFADAEYNGEDAQYVIAITNTSDKDMTYGMMEDTFSLNDISYGMAGPYTTPIVLKSGQSGLFSFNMAKSDFTDLFKVDSYDEIKTVDFTLLTYPSSTPVLEGDCYKYESDESEPLSYEIHIDME